MESVGQIIVVIRENEDDWSRRSREETKQLKKREKEERLRKVTEKKKKFGGKGGKESKGEKRESEERLRRKLALVEIRKNIWRSYRVGNKMVKLEEYFIESS